MSAVVRLAAFVTRRAAEISEATRQDSHTLLQDAQDAKRERDALAKRVKELEDYCESPDLCTPEERAALNVLKRRRIVVCPRCNGHGSGPGPCRAICKQCQGECLCVDDGKSNG